MAVALSTGCFIGHEARLAAARLPAVELSSHAGARLPEVIAALRESRAQVVGVHTPCPNHGYGLDPGADAQAWLITERGLIEAAEVAESVGAEYVLVHAFYVRAGALPSGDAERMLALRALAHEAPMPMREYVLSEPYQTARARAIGNLKGFLPRFRRRFPRLRLVLENLNPRHGYGGIAFQDVVEIAAAFGGEVGLCLDVGHLALAEAALSTDMSAQVSAGAELISSVHVHQNFRGRYCVDRHWADRDPRESLQDVDTHLPLDVVMWRRVEDAGFAPGRENSAFLQSLEGAVLYDRAAGAVAVRGEVPVERLLALVPAKAHRVLELDSRYVPLDDVLADYARAVGRF